MAFGHSKAAFVRRLVLADILARPGEGPLARRFPVVPRAARPPAPDAPPPAVEPEPSP